ncbi:unnamed protein product [Arabis nemorensis]|uniref:ATPase AAA-type core domain-containing protein n=1 Tax=Arabis nemorensis TaxID=586526 RepID=A0A565BS83_9BRAS|nr:unnamed protein product [Arabis nemorensis]
MQLKHWCRRLLPQGLPCLDEKTKPRICSLPTKGILIVGERGTGKTSLELAIASEARVPIVNVEAQELEAGLWVGQSAANVRELFQTARDLVRKTR